MTSDTLILFVRLLAGFIAVVTVLTLHEFSHAFVAYKCGDPTAKLYGRMTLNPLKHFDPMGLFFFVFAHFGWAKPVPVNTNNFNNRKWGNFWTSAAGILTNYLSAFLIFYPLACLTSIYVAPVFAGTYFSFFLTTLTYNLYWYSISFAVFNFLPFYPLDGFRVCDTLVGYRSKAFNYLRQYGSYILMGLILIRLFSDYFTLLKYFDILGYAMQYLGGILSWPIQKLWGLIF